MDITSSFTKPAVAQWFLQAIGATLCIVPAFLSIPFFKKNFGVDPLLFLTWYFAGTAITNAFVVRYAGFSRSLVPDATVVGAMLAIGLTFGAAANGLLFLSVANAPNPGLPPVIYGSSSMIVFVLAAVFAVKIPRLFNAVNTDLDRFVGILFVLLGLFFIAGGWGYLRSALSLR